MILISHRGNINGVNGELENTPEYIDSALFQNYNVEVDVSFYKDKLYLGHNVPMVELPKKYLNNNKIWFHAKDIYAMTVLLDYNAVCFGNDKDNFVLTSNGFIWTWNIKTISNKSIVVLPERVNNFLPICAGVCSDYILNYKY